MKIIQLLKFWRLQERFYNKQVDINLVKSGSGYDIDVPHVKDYFMENNLTDKEFYLFTILKKLLFFLRDIKILILKE